MGHAFFRDINWRDLRDRKVPAPYKPIVTSGHDTRNIDKMFTNEKPAETPEATMPKSAARKTQFGGFTYNKDNLGRQGGKEWNQKTKYHPINQILEFISWGFGVLGFWGFGEIFDF